MPLTIDLPEGLQPDQRTVFKRLCKAVRAPIADTEYDRRRGARGGRVLALQHDWQVENVYVHRPFPDVVRAVLERSQRTGRWNTLADVARAHVQAQATILQLRQKFGGGRSLIFRAQFNASKGLGDRPAGARVFFHELARGGRYHLASSETLIKTIPPLVEQAIHEGLASREIARLVCGDRSQSSARKGRSG